MTFAVLLTREADEGFVASNQTVVVGAIRHQREDDYH